MSDSWGVNRSFVMGNPSFTPASVMKVGVGGFLPRLLDVSRDG